ncbi:sensor histidine kinase NtrY-like [Desulfohalobium retbaense]|uniref:histidine kinase n=1 Tax=Desulfohalobium retbaense (strain ATCC 49708 / DSM 5692 / JCM 16813 / HR100) TaxID=485915 RepID=C8WYS8_DESRD|nr:ATP-binding protein [Desulfohalobium retbaense]ACV67844.1 PAS/PAC sensor signal transduction histidine kinase [Desulfohalobium retbaense DSM 5692]
MAQDPIRISGPDTRERRRRQRELLLAAGAVGLIVLLTWIELQFFGVNSYLFLAFFNLNLILLLLILFLVLRNGVKLLLERRRRVLGARLRTRLVLAFMSLSLIPTILMFLVAVRFVQTSVDFWFKSQIESSLDQAVKVGQGYYRQMQNQLETQGVFILESIRRREFAWGGEGMDDFLKFKRHEYGLSLVGVLQDDLQQQNWHGSENWEQSWSAFEDSVDWETLRQNPRFWSGMRPGPEADLVVGIVPVDEAKTGFLVVGRSMEKGLLRQLDNIIQGMDEYKQLKTLKFPLKVALYLILAVMTLLILLGAMWFGFRLAKEISAPVQALAVGTQRIARGDLSVRLEDQSSDEIGLLVQSFNKMAGDLEQSQDRLRLANDRLARQNRELEERGRYMEAVLNNITAGVISLDSHGQINTVNAAAETILGTAAEQLVGQNPLELLQGEQAELVQEMLSQLTQAPHSQWQRQLDLELGGQVRKLLVNAVVLQTGEGERAGLVAVFEDVTELDKMQRMAAWREVARRIAHEIKNPLTPIKLSAQRLQRKFGDQVQDGVFTQSTELIIRQVEHLQQMVSEFSAFAKLPEVHPKRDEITPLVQEVVALFRQSHNTIQWTVEEQDETPPFRFDREAIKRVLMNLLTNAAEALQGGNGSTVDISVDCDVSSGWVRLQIADNGPGLSPEERSRLFEPYFSRKKGGTGLGLTIVKSLVNDHHGYVRIKPNSPHGSVFVVELPLV